MCIIKKHGHCRDMGSIETWNIIEMEHYKDMGHYGDTKHYRDMVIIGTWGIAET